MDGTSTSGTVPKTPQPLHVDRILTRKPDAPISSAEDLFCELPSCDLVFQSRLESHRCGSLGKSSPPWPLLITSTPRSATVFMQTSLRDHGMQIQDDWHRPLRDGRVSWMHAFDDTDQNTYGKGNANGKRYSHILHQVKEPLSGITSICTEPILKGALPFLRRHIPFQSSYLTPTSNKREALTRSCLEFWVEWHTFLTAMRFPTFRVFDMKLHDVFAVSGMSHLYQEEGRTGSAKTNRRGHRATFTWEELYTIDPSYALKAWELAQYYGYDYPGVDFNNLTCLTTMPTCVAKPKFTKASEKCSPGRTYNDTIRSNRNIVPPSTDLGFVGWADSGCVEAQLSNGTYVGIRGLVSQEELDRIKDDLDPSLLTKLNSMLIPTQSNDSVPDNTVKMVETLELTNSILNNNHLFILAMWTWALAILYWFRTRRQMTKNE